MKVEIFFPQIVKTPVYAAPAVAVAPVVKHVVPAATSYQTFNQVNINSSWKNSIILFPISEQVHVTHPQPIVKYAAAPVVKYAAPVAPLVHAPAVRVYYHNIIVNFLVNFNTFSLCSMPLVQSTVTVSATFMDMDINISIASNESFQ